MGEIDPAPAEEPGWKYRAFVSYSHADNRETGRHWADWLHSALETFTVPPELAGRSDVEGHPTPARIFPVFQDEKELPTSANLGGMIEDALRGSAFLVVLCSPRSARSLWVAQEILFFKSLGRADRILPLILSGEPNASEPGKEHLNPEEECFPEAIRYALGPDGRLDRQHRVEPIAADLRAENGRERSTDAIEDAPFLDREKLRVIAGILRVGFDELIQRDKQRQILQALREQEERRERARSLVAGSREKLRRLEQEAPAKAADHVFGTLGEVEDDLQNAIGLDDANPEATPLLRQVRRTVVEIGIRSGDLNTASLFLRRLKLLGPPDERATGLLAQRLETAWDQNDPKRNPNIHRLLWWGLLGPILTVIWGVASHLLGRRMDLAFFNYYLDVILVVDLLPQLFLLILLVRAKLGYEQGLSDAFVTGYVALFLGLFTANLPALLVSARILSLAANPQTLSVVWQFAKAAPTGPPRE